VSPSTQIQSVNRAATVLELVADNGGMRASQIAAELSVPLPTMFHLLSTLTDVGLLDKLDDRRYQLGPKVGFLAEAFAAQVSAPEHLLTRLREMAERTGETAYLSAWRRGDATLLSIVEGRRAVRVSGLHLGYSGATHTRASGRVLLAFSGPDAIDEYLAHHDLRSSSSRTATSDAALRKVIEQVREDGYAIDEEEFAEGVSCVAAPVVDGRMAMGLSAPSERFRENREELIGLVLEITSKTIKPSTQIGGVR
jgi:IclR family transcriptional regulator, acetate operon repressor